jgi:pheromone shutdown protein TraB
MLTTQPEARSALIPVSESAGLRYLINNPDVMVHARKIVGRSGIEPGRDFQRAMESVALEHYNSFGINEGRHLDGLNSSSRLTLKSKSNTIPPQATEQLLNVSNSAALTYLVNNSDVMVHARKIVGASGISPGREFQRAMERAAINHYNTFGKNEGRSGFGE